MGLPAQSFQFVPPLGYGGGDSATLPGVTDHPEPGAPALTRIPDLTLSGLFRANQSYRRASISGQDLWPAAAATAKVVGAFAVAEPPRTHLIAAWSPGFLPVTLSFSDGRCFSLSADYDHGTLSNGRLNRVGCEGRRTFDLPPPPKPSNQSLRLLASAGGYSAWTNAQTGTTTVTVPWAKTFESLFTARMKATAMMALNSIDAPLGNVTLVGRINGRLTIVTLEVGY
jgi:hypothetical protein